MLIPWRDFSGQPLNQQYYLSDWKLINEINIIRGFFQNTDLFWKICAVIFSLIIISIYNFTYCCSCNSGVTNKKNLKQTTRISAWYNHFLKPETFLISEKTLTSNLILPHAKIPWAIIQDTWLEIKTKKLQTYEKKIKNKRTKANANKMPGNIICK